MKSILFKKLSYNITRITLSVLASVAVMTAVAYAASTIGTNFSADGTLSVTATSTLSSDLRVDTNTLVVDSFNDRVGVGTTSPYAKLSVVGETVSSYFTATSTTATSTFAGGLSITGTGNGLNFGSNTLFYQNNQRFLTSSTTSAGNLTIGYQTPTSLDANGGLYNTGVGYQALGNATSTDYNTALGYQALKGSATISNLGLSTAVGAFALYNNTTGNYNVAVGQNALSANTTGSANNAFGWRTLQSNTTGSFNTANGRQSLNSNTTGGQNTGIGLSAMFSNTTGSNNTVSGYESLYYNASATSTTAVGNQAGYGVSGSYFQNAALFGYRAGYGLTTGNNNTLLGYKAGDALTSGSNNIVLGYDIDAPAVDSANTLNIGNLIFGTSIDGTGTTLSSGKIGIGTSTPVGKLSVSSGASATTTINIGDMYSGTGKSCFNAATNTGGVVSFYFVGTTMVVEANVCR